MFLIFKVGPGACGGCFLQEIKRKGKIVLGKVVSGEVVLGKMVLRKVVLKKVISGRVKE